MARPFASAGPPRAVAYALYSEVEYGTTVLCVSFPPKRKTTTSAL
jgi:hypothetical protein